MSRSDDLIAELCPGGVQFKMLGELGVIFGGLTGKSKADFSDGNARFVSYVNVYRNPAVDLQADDYVRVSLVERQRALQRGDILFTGSSETANDVALSSVVTADVHEPLYLNSFTIGYRLNDPTVFDPEFTKHLFRSGEMRKQLVRTANGVTRFNVSKARLAKVEVPLLPVDVQREIVRVLDSFKTLEAELTKHLQAELEARQQQYVHYRDALLTYPDEVQRTSLNDICSRVTSGGTPSTRHPEYYGGDIPWVRTSEVDYRAISSTELTITTEGLHNSSAKWIPARSVIVAMIGATAAKVAFTEVDVTTNQNCCNLIVDPNKAHYKFVYYWLCREYKNLRALAPGAVPIINAGTIKQYRIPAPSLEEQNRVVEILDRFIAVVNDLNIQLPAELTGRRKQYEYYRDRLLTFKELPA